MDAERLGGDRQDARYRDVQRSGTERDEGDYGEDKRQYAEACRETRAEGRLTRWSEFGGKYERHVPNRSP